jgi:hypothetical protein
MSDKSLAIEVFESGSLSVVKSQVNNFIGSMSREDFVDVRLSTLIKNNQLTYNVMVIYRKPNTEKN